jgi:CDP-paratose 2-epimerase
LIGAEAARFFPDKGLDIVGIDNDMRRLFLGMMPARDGHA